MRGSWSSASISPIWPSAVVADVAVGVQRIVGSVGPPAGEHAEVSGTGHAGVSEGPPRPQNGHRVLAPHTTRYAAMI